MSYEVVGVLDGNPMVKIHPSLMIFIGAAMPRKDYFQLETYCYLYFQVKTVVTTA